MKEINRSMLIGQKEWMPSQQDYYRTSSADITDVGSVCKKKEPFPAERGGIHHRVKRTLRAWIALGVKWASISARQLIGCGRKHFSFAFPTIPTNIYILGKINHCHGNDSHWSVWSDPPYCTVECLTLCCYFPLAHADAGADTECHKPSSRLVSLVGARVG